MTPGVNRLPPVGLTLFSVGVGAEAGDDVVVIVVVVVVVDGPCALVPQAATKVLNAISAEPLAMAL